MASGMGLEIGKLQIGIGKDLRSKGMGNYYLRECLFTVGKFTLVWLFPSVRPNMLLQMRKLRELKQIKNGTLYEKAICIKMFLIV
jgi:hypothetical protein